MNSDIRTILEKIVTIIGYQKDKSAFINEFMDLCMRKALVDYMNLLPEERKKELQKILLESDPNKLKEQLEPYLETEEYKKLLQENTQKLFQDYFEAIMPTLSEEQKNSLDLYFTSLISGKSSVLPQHA